MNVLMYIATPGGLTGAPRRMLTLAKALRNEGLEVFFASDSRSELLEAAQEEGFRTIGLGPVGILSLRHGQLFKGGVLFRLKTLFGLLLQNFYFFRAVRSSNADLVWVRGSKGIAFSGIGALMSRRPLLWDVDYEPPSQGAVRYLHLLGLFCADKIVFQYDGAGEEVFGPSLAGKHMHKFISLVPGIDFSPLRCIRKYFISEHSRVRPKFSILQVGTICDRKNQHLIVEAIKLISDRSWELRFAGGIFERSYYESLQNEISKSGLEPLVEFLGWRKDIHSLIASADLVVMPSKDEGVPNAIQESMYIGVPVIVSPVGGMSQIVQHNKTGWVLPLDSSLVWSKQIEACIENRKGLEGVGLAAATYARRNFSIDCWGERYANIMIGMIKKT